MVIHTVLYKANAVFWTEINSSKCKNLRYLIWKRPQFSADARGFNIASSEYNAIADQDARTWYHNLYGLHIHST
jgi:hypothetical protein